MAYVSNYLTHWAGSRMNVEEQYELLTKKILKAKLLKYNPCHWNFVSRYGGIKPSSYKIPMICFTDIPFSQTETHCAKYSQFGISFRKEYMSNALASPVGYVSNPLIFENYSFIMYALNSLKGRDEGVTFGASTGRFAGREVKIEQILGRFQYIMGFLESVSKKEFKFNPSGSEPVTGQENFFEDEESLYFEREWRMGLSADSPNLPWNTKIGEEWFFKFDEKHMGPIIMPRSYIPRITKERDEVFSGYQSDLIPPILAYEDLRSM